MSGERDMSSASRQQTGNGAKPGDEIVMSCRARLARNVAGFPFTGKASATQRNELLNLARQVLLSSGLAERMTWIDLHEASDQHRKLLVERHLISKQFAESSVPRGVAISGDEALSIMVNEEDHLRMQVLAPGGRLRGAFDRINQIDDRVEASLDYAFSPRWGYLTACPTNLGTGIRFSMMLHLPALNLSNEIERVRRAARELNLAVRGYYGEGSDSAGDFYQISNQVTLGCTEPELLDEFQDKVMPQIVDYELEARRLLMKNSSNLLDDRVHRAVGILRSARLLGSDEAMKLLSRVRLGILTGRIIDPSLDVVNCLFPRIQPAHLRQEMGAQLSPDELREARATLIRKSLC
jgi:protein arginine kinase